MTTQLDAFSIHSFGSLLISDDQAVGGTITAPPAVDATIAAATSDASSEAAFTDQIDLFGDPTIQTIVLVFGGVVVLLAGLSVLSQKVDAAIESVIVDFETVLRTTPEFQSKWEEIELQVEEYCNNTVGDRDMKRKQKLVEIMEDLQEKEPALMGKISARMKVLTKS